jgi:hypothetical protein
VAGYREGVHALTLASTAGVAPPVQPLRFFAPFGRLERFPCGCIPCESAGLYQDMTSQVAEKRKTRGPIVSC